MERRGLFAVRPLLITRRHLTMVLPLVDRQLASWRQRALEIPNPMLRDQAIASLTHKRFHCEGGSVFAAWAATWQSDLGPAAEQGSSDDRALNGESLVRFIVALQTISDYLDNLCDRTESLDPVDFRQLHRSMFDAISPSEPVCGDYYLYHPNQEDGGYLDSLVDACREALSEFPGYEGVQSAVRHYISLYVDLQILKHIAPERRVPELERWFEGHAAHHSELRWWEFAAASGSTLAVFALVGDAARRSSIEEPGALSAAYFPWICGLHILLDYLIDQEEDLREGDLNFVSFYSDRQEIEERMTWILEHAVRTSRRLKDPHFHATVIEGLLGLYLSDPKVDEQGLEPLAKALLRRAGWRARLVHAYCRVWRRKSQRLRERRMTRGVERA